jgi:carboxymethylenebutenolidase
MAGKTAHQNTTFPLPDKDPGQDGDRLGHGYLATPESGSGPGVIVTKGAFAGAAPCARPTG